MAGYDGAGHHGVTTNDHSRTKARRHLHPSSHGEYVSSTPATLAALGAFWTAQGGVNLGVVGNTAHTVGYHLGRDRIYDGTGPGLGDNDYSVQHARDRAGLTNAASAIDLGRLDGSLPQLYAFSRWLVARCMADAATRRDIREIIYSPDGDRVQRWSGIDNAIHTGVGNGDASHIGHSHISYFRDSQARDKIAAFRPYFAEVENMAQLPITDVTPVMIGIAEGSRRYMLDGTPDGYTFDQDYTRLSPYGVGSMRAYYAVVDGKRVLRLVIPDAWEPIPVDCRVEVDAAVADITARVRAALEE